jgi:hypothetical protein
VTKIPVVFLPAILLATGCSGLQKPVSALKPEAEHIAVGMQPEQVKAICGEPSMNITDPLSGAAVWMYKDTKVGDHLTVNFNMDGVAKVVYGAS